MGVQFYAFGQEGLTCKGSHGHRIEGCKVLGVRVPGESTPGPQEPQAQRREVGMCPGHPKISKEARVAGAGWEESSEGLYGDSGFTLRKMGAVGGCEQGREAAALLFFKALSCYSVEKTPLGTGVESGRWLEGRIWTVGNGGSDHRGGVRGRDEELVQVPSITPSHTEALRDGGCDHHYGRG